MAKVPIKRGQTKEQIENYYFHLELRAQVDSDMILAAARFSWREGDHPNYIKCCEYGRLGFEAAAAVVHPLILVYNYIYRYHRNHTPWESIPIPTENHPLISPYEVYRCLLKLSRENQELILRQFSLTNRQRDDILTSLLPTGNSDEFVAIYGELTNDQEMSNLCWELGLYHPDEDELIFSRLLGMPELYDDYLDRTRTEDWEEIEQKPITNLDVLNRVQGFYDQYCEGRRHLKENDEFINKREKEIINEILMRPEGDFFRKAYESGKDRLIEYDAATLEVVNIDYTITSCPPFDDIDWIEVENPTSEENAGQYDGATGQDDTPKRGRGADTWCIKPWTEKTFGKNIKKMVWPYLREELRGYNYGIDKERENAKFEGAVKASAAALIVYCSDRIGLSSTSPVTSITPSMERTFSFLPAPRSTAAIYYKRLTSWYETIAQLNPKQINEKTLNTLERWKREDRTRGYFIIENASKLKKLINNNLPYLLAAVFNIESNIEYTETNAAYDKALYMAVEYNDKIKKNKNGHKQKTGMEMSDHSDKD